MRKTKVNKIILTSITTMKRLIILIVPLFIIHYSVFCQSNKNDYIKFTSESEVDSIYCRISAKDNSSYGFINNKEEIVIPLGKYSFLNPIDRQGMILAKKEGKKGYIDIKENILIPFIYDNIGVFSDSQELAPAIQNQRQGFINRKGELVIPFEYDGGSRVSYFYDAGLAILQKDEKYGAIDVNNKIIIPFKYENIEWSNQIESLIATESTELTLFSLEGKVVSKYDNTEIVSNFSYNYNNPNTENLPILLKKNDSQTLLNSITSDIKYQNGSKRVKDSLMLQAKNEFAYIDKKGNWIVPFGKYNTAKPFALGRKAIVARDRLYGIINEYGNEVLPLEYDFIEQPSENSRYADIYIATKGKKVTILDSNLNIVPLKDIVSYIDRDGYLMVSDKNNKKGIVNYLGEQIIPFEYDTLIRYSQTHFIAKKGSSYGYITNDNELIKPFDYRYIYTLHGGLAFVNQKGKVGLCDDEGKTIVPFEYDAIYNTWYEKRVSKTNAYIVVKDGKVGTIDSNNKTIIPLIYEALSGWIEYGPEAHFARKDGKYGLVSHRGEIIIPIEYEYVGLPSKGFIKVRKNGKYGVMTFTNEEVLPCIYDKLILDIPFFDFYNEEDPKIVVCKDGKWSFFDIKGNLQQENITQEEIVKKYGQNILQNNNEPSNEGYDFHMMQYPIVKYLDNNIEPN